MSRIFCSEISPSPGAVSSYFWEQNERGGEGAGEGVDCPRTRSGPTTDEAWRIIRWTSRRPTSANTLSGQLTFKRRCETGAKRFEAGPSKPSLLRRRWHLLSYWVKNYMITVFFKYMLSFDFFKFLHLHVIQPMEIRGAAYIAPWTSESVDHEYWIIE